ncbi:MAG: hypothetical protein ACOVQ4_20470 [Flectobacillus sp.]|uniref:hypothetical protein n=1 Tax=Flectobacillus sp. TaxID=50419 RepID=UPI003B9A9328
MKKLILTCCVAALSALSFTSKAQFDPNTKYWQLGGSLATNNTTYGNLGREGLHSNSISLNFRKGKFGENNVAKGWLLDYSLQTYSGSTLNMTSYQHRFGAGYFMSKFQPITQNLALYAEALGKAQYLYNTSEGSTGTDGWAATIEGNVGLRYSMKNKWFLDLGTNVGTLQYQSVGDVKNFSGAIVPNIGTFKISIGKTF